MWLALSPDAKGNSSPLDLPTKVGQFFIFGIPDTGPVLSLATQRHLNETRPGSFIIFKRNIQTNDQIKLLIQNIQSTSKTLSGSQAFIALDQEGGSVSRVQMTPQMPSPWTVAQTKDPGLARSFGWSVGKNLSDLGFNMNLAPVLDVGEKNSYSFLGSRAFSSDVDLVSNIGVAFAEGLLAANVLPVAKHFPGLGPVINDPHKVLVRRSIAKEELWRRDLVPFINFSRLPDSAIMISHFVYPKLDSQNIPATFSKPIISGLLRGSLGYQGLVMTDDLMMDGAQTKNFKQGVVQAFNAGADLIMVSWSRHRQKLAVTALTEAVRSGKIPMQEFESRLQRVLRIKNSLSKETLPSPLMASGDYKSLVRRITEINLDQQLKTIKMAQARRYCLMPEQQHLGLSFFTGLQRAAPLSLASPGAEQFDEFCDENGMLMLFVRTKKDFEIAKNFPAEIRKRTLLVNQVRPSLLKQKYPMEIQIFSHNDDLPMMISERLRPGYKIKPMPNLGGPEPLSPSIGGPTNPVPLAIEQFPTESDSSLGRPASAQ